MNCRDCIHFEVCKEWSRYNNENINLTITNCQHFKSKAKFLQLPCKVGDEIYDVSFDSDNDYNHINIHTVQDVSAKGIWFANEMCLYEDLGELVFLDLDQARAKLITEIARTKSH